MSGRGRWRALALVAGVGLLVALYLGFDASRTRAPGFPPSPWGDHPPIGPPIERPLLWTAERDGVTSHLLGTYHLGVDAERQLPPWVMARLDGSRAFASEVDVTGADFTALIQRPDGGSLHADLEPRHWTKLGDLLGRRVTAAIDSARPFVAYSMLMARHAPWTPPMDGTLEARARAAGKPIAHLEELGAQVAVLDSITARDLQAYLDNVDTARAQGERLRAAYLRGDEAAMRTEVYDTTLWVASGRDVADFAAAMKPLLADRNVAWIPVIERLHGEGGAFIAVGAAHLIGDTSVLELLAARGFTITRVTGP